MNRPVIPVRGNELRLVAHLDILNAHLNAGTITPMQALIELGDRWEVTTDIERGKVRRVLDS